MPHPIQTSVFDIFKIGPGPSSSHSIGPMKAGYDFITRAGNLSAEKLGQATGLEVRLYGSLSATGVGHGTHRSVLAGLLGYAPETVPQAVLLDLELHPETLHPLPVAGLSLCVSGENVIFDEMNHNFPYNNTLIIRLLKAKGVLLEMEYYSIGGGFIHVKGEKAAEQKLPPYPYSTMAELKEQLKKSGLELYELVIENEKALHNRSEEEIYTYLSKVCQVMRNAVSRGCSTTGVLPGEIGLQRKAPVLLQESRVLHSEAERFMLLLNAYAMGAAEENAAGHVVVTAPTSGSAGVIPGILMIMQSHMGMLEHTLYRSFLVGAAIGFLVKHNASLAGAEVGCQGEIGTASAMAAAMLAYAYGKGIRVIENAAEISLEHHLGMTCDPVGGYVQVPCVERNAMGAVKAYNAALLACFGNPEHQVIGLDKVIWTMQETGKDMHSKYKETGMGGLALHIPQC